MEIDQKLLYKSVWTKYPANHQVAVIIYEETRKRPELHQWQLEIRYRSNGTTTVESRIYTDFHTAYQHAEDERFALKNDGYTLVFHSVENEPVAPEDALRTEKKQLIAALAIGNAELRNAIEAAAAAPPSARRNERLRKAERQMQQLLAFLRLTKD